MRIKQENKMIDKIWKRRRSGNVPMADCITKRNFKIWCRLNGFVGDEIPLSLGPLYACGGNVKFPYSKVQHYTYCWRVGKPRRGFNIGEYVIGRGDTLQEAAMDGLVTAYELQYYRRHR